MSEVVVEEEGVAVPIRVGEMFQCLVLAPADRQFGSGLQLRDDLWACDGIPAEAAEHWEKWLGSIAMRALRRSFVLTLVAKQPKAGVVSDPDLQQRIYRLNYALSLLGVCGFEQVCHVGGANEGGTPEVRQFGRMGRPHYPSRDMGPAALGLEELKRAVRLAERMALMDRAGPKWRRFRRGIDALNQGLAERSLQDNRIHQFVRALEALVLPEAGKSKKQFVHRCQTFAVASEEARQVLEDAYEVRSRVEHLHNALDVVSPTSTVEEKERALYRRARQMDQLSRFAIRRVLEDDKLLAIAEDDNRIDEFWKRPENERVAVFGERLDLSKIE